MSTSKRLPTTSDFPSSWTLTVSPPPSSQRPTNILILLHGLGDAHLPFAQLGTQMNLPETACISIKAPEPLPFEASSFHWGDDVIFDNTVGTIDPDGGFKKVVPRLVKEIIEDTLIKKCGYQPRELMLFGFGQGGMVVLSIAVSMEKELGGVISVGGPLPSEAVASLSPKRKTPILVCSGSDSPWVTSSAENKLKAVFESVQFNRYRRSGDTMPKRRDEMYPIMQFFARRLKSSAGVPEGSVELSA
ncbi:alpha/beta-hydrolase [Aureobasidium pullulans]|uniref:Alpha/beta-hydrolase n=1 Tax=Aureobasidium pullulans TaxID=5580 RepID=A0A4V4L122_AURPU|nr:alpha/beta-hydrolase [Aureobasidium pullulans]